MGIQRLLDSLARFVPERSDTNAPLRLAVSNGGLLSILVTTDLGIERFGQDGPSGSSRMVVLRAAGFEDTDHGYTLEPAVISPQGAWIGIDGPDQAASTFRSQWERICHDVWCTV